MSVDEKAIKYAILKQFWGDFDINELDKHQEGITVCVTDSGGHDDTVNDMAADIISEINKTRVAKGGEE